MIDRSKFKKTSVSQMQQEDKQLNKTLGRKEKTSNGHDIDDGANLFRFYPPHPEDMDGGDNFAQPFAQTFLPAYVPERDKDGKEIKDSNGQVKLKLSVRPVFNSMVHGGTPKDLVDEYIKLARQNAKDLNLSESDAKEYLIGIYGRYSKDPNKNVQGIRYNPLHVVYADKYPAGNSAAVPVFDELRLKKSIKDRLNAISAVEAANDPLGTDPFTDPDEGRAVRIFKNPDAGDPKNYYTTELDNTQVSEEVNGKIYKSLKTYPLTDDQLEYFLQQEPLAKKYGKKIAGRKNFERQLAGLELFDSKFEMGIFELSAWSDIVSEIDGYYPESDPEDVTDDKEEDGTQEDNDTSSQDEFDLMDRKELKVYAKDNKTGILVKASMSDDQIRELLREWKKESEIKHVALPGDEDYEEEEGEDQNENEDEGEEDQEPEPVEQNKKKDNFVQELKDAGKEKKLTAKEKLELLRARQKATKSA